MVDSSSSEGKLGEIALPTAMDKEQISPSINPLFMGGYYITKKGTSIVPNTHNCIVFLLALFIIPCSAHDYETRPVRNLFGEEGEGR